MKDEKTGLEFVTKESLDELIAECVRKHTEGKESQGWLRDYEKNLDGVMRILNKIQLPALLGDYATCDVYLLRLIVLSYTALMNHILEDHSDPAKVIEKVVKDVD